MIMIASLPPFLFAIYHLLFLYSANIAEVPVEDTFRPLLIAVATIFFLRLLLRIVVRKNYIPDIILTTLCFLFFSYNILVDCLDLVNIKIFENFVVIHLVSLITFVSLVFMSIFFLSRLPAKHLPKITKILNISALCLIFMQIITIIGFYVSTGGSSSDYVKGSKNQPSQANYPDVYFIMLDAYAREDVLEEMYDFDNSAFINFLEGKGFYVAHKSRTNYNFTAQSLASQLNLTYLHDIPGLPGPKSKNFLDLNYLILNSEVRKLFESHGYKYIYNIEQADKFMMRMNIKPKPGYIILFTEKRNDFEEFVLHLTPLRPFEAFLNRASSEKRRDEILFRLRYITEVMKDPSPTFLHTHVICPHAPFVFDKNGGEIANAKGKLIRTWDHRYYAGQLAYTNTVVKKIIEDLLVNSPQKPVIIIQSDHGPESRHNRSSYQKTDLKERFSNFFAVYSPRQNYEGFYQNMSLVNSFRIILNKMFGKNYNLLEDKMYYLPIKYPYKFTDVTDRIRD